MNYYQKQVYCGEKPFPMGPCKTVSIGVGNVKVDDSTTINSFAFQSIMLKEAVNPVTTTTTTTSTTESTTAASTTAESTTAASTTDLTTNNA